jgi:hypothetical protein
MLPKRLTNFIRDHDASLPDEVQGDWRYDFRVLLIARTGPKTEADAAMRFVRQDEMPEEAREVVQTIVRTRSIAVQNKGRYKPGGVSLKAPGGAGDGRLRSRTTPRRGGTSRYALRRIPIGQN